MCNLTAFCWIIFLPQSQFWYKVRVFLGLFCRLEDSENGHLGNQIPDSSFPWYILQWVGAFQSLATSLDNMKVNGCFTQALVFQYRIHWFSGKEVTGIWEPSTWIHVSNVISWNINAVVHWYITHMWWNSWIHCKYIRFKFMGNQSKSCLSKLFLPHFYEFLEHIEIILGNFCVVLLGNNNSNITNEHSILHDPQGNSISNQGGVLHMGLRGEKTIA